ncbi:hypothetical protein [Streptomyces sp. NBC_00690]|uniref:hypothetical protein n=1 Tax=Streptomyces sp. NBC_00690 TaxID=2975808 RepID=UPI002E286BAF|nr:hypothetical protein [Streptomyces sp. NBC_00690]
MLRTRTHTAVDARRPGSQVRQLRRAAVSLVATVAERLDPAHEEFEQPLKHRP